MSSPFKRKRDDLDKPRPNTIQQCTTGLSAYQSIKQRSLRGNRMFVSSQPILNLFTNPSNMAFQFIYPSNELCIPGHCDYAHFLHGGSCLAVGDEDGRVTLLRTDHDNDSQDNEVHGSFYCHSSMITDVKWSNDDSMMLTSGNDKLIKLWDTETTSALATFEGHCDALKTVNWHSVDEHMFISSSMDGSFKIWDTRLKQVPASDPDDVSRIPVYNSIKSIENAHNDQNQTTKGKKKNGVRPRILRSVTCALFLDSGDTQVITSGSNDGAIKLWDIRAGRTPQVIASSLFQSSTGTKKGITDLKLDHSGTRLFSACFDNHIYMHYLSDLSQPARRYTDPELRLNSFDTRVSISPDDKFLLSGSESGDVYMWSVDGSKNKAHIYKAHTARSTSVAWNRTQYYQFATCSEDFTTRIWGIDFNTSFNAL
ncbi:WD40 repeat-like protein [Backusella circina FSU 941]|nr:WD40 repeat-like protein [Backusella circina FSU 941]